MKTRNLSSLALLGGKPGSARQIADPTGCAVSRYGRRDARCAGWLDFSNPFDSNEIGFDRPGLHRPESRPQCTKRPNHAQPVIAGHPIGPAFIQFQPDSARPPRTLFARRIKRFAVAIGRQGVGRGPGGPPTMNAGVRLGKCAASTHSLKHVIRRLDALHAQVHLSLRAMMRRVRKVSPQPFEARQMAVGRTN